MKKMLAIAFVMLLGVTAQANGKLYLEDAQYELGKRSDETATEYEARICEARKMWSEAEAYIDSNMMWTDDKDFQRTLRD